MHVRRMIERVIYNLSFSLFPRSAKVATALRCRRLNTAIFGFGAIEVRNRGNAHVYLSSLAK